MGCLDGVVVSVGELGNQQKAEVDFDQAQRIIDSNYTGVVSVLQTVANYLQQQGSGFIIGISSVAGDRGRGIIIAGAILYLGIVLWSGAEQFWTAQVTWTILALAAIQVAIVLLLQRYFLKPLDRIQKLKPVVSKVDSLISSAVFCLKLNY